LLNLGSMKDEAGIALIVSSEEPVRARCAEMPAAAGLGVRTAGDREAALAEFAHGDIDVVIASAPEVDGAALLMAIREHDARLPVIFVTEWPDFSDVASLASGSAHVRSPAESLRSAVIRAAITHQVGRTRG